MLPSWSVIMVWILYEKMCKSEGKCETPVLLYLNVFSTIDTKQPILLWCNGSNRFSCKTSYCACLFWNRCWLHMTMSKQFESTIEGIYHCVYSLKTNNQLRCWCIGLWSVNTLTSLSCCREDNLAEKPKTVSHGCLKRGAQPCRQIGCPQGGVSQKRQSPKEQQ